MGADVKSLHGGEIVSPNEPDPFIVNFLKDHVARAERGEIKALALVTVDPMGLPSAAYTENGRTTPLLAGTTMIQHEMVRAMPRNAYPQGPGAGPQPEPSQETEND